MTLFPLPHNYDVWFAFCLFTDDVFMIYRQASNISRILVGNKIVDHPDVVGASHTALLQLHLHSRPGFNGLHKDNSKMRQETFRLGNLARLALEI